ncbi:MAG: antA/AntB antirepressor family protein [Cetobacterium sp.]
MANLIIVSTMGLINIHEMDNGEQVVMARELHEKLEIGTRFDTWFNRMKEYGFVENTDFVAIAQKRATAQGNMTVSNEYICKLDMAKQIAMIQRSEQGKQLREYFLELERAWNSPEQVWARALKMADKVQADLRLELQTAKPKVEYFDALMDSETLYDTTAIAKELGLRSATFLNRFLNDERIQYKLADGSKWVLYAKHTGKGWVGDKTRMYDSKSLMYMAWTEVGRKMIKDLWNSKFN